MQLSNSKKIYSLFRQYVNTDLWWLIAFILIALIDAIYGQSFWLMLQFIILFFQVQRYVETIGVRILWGEMDAAVGGLDIKRKILAIVDNGKVVHCKIHDNQFFQDLNSGKILLTYKSRIKAEFTGKLTNDNHIIHDIIIHHIKQIYSNN